MKTTAYQSIAGWMIAFVLMSATESGAEQTVPLSSLDLTKMSAGWGSPRVDQNIVGKPMSIGGRKLSGGVGTHANSTLRVRLDGKPGRFTALVGVDDETGVRGTIRFQVHGGDKRKFDSGVMRGGDAAKQVNVDLSGVKTLILLVTDGGDGVDYDHANWAAAQFEVTGDKPVAIDAPVVNEAKVVLTPRPGPQPSINGPRLFGVRSGHPFIYRIPCTGKRPITFGVDHLPNGLSVDVKTGIITGRAPEEDGNYVVTLKAKNALGVDDKKFTIVVGETLALTPPMGWNSWYIHYNRVTEKHMRHAADTMIDSGMADYGYMYVNIDDCWMKKRGDEPYRDAAGAVLTNAKFPDIKGMCDYIHAKGLRAGTYISPGPWTCAGYVGSYQHEEIDAKKFAEWGFDFLKYDWCSYGNVYGERMKQSKDDLLEKKHPYQQMGDILKTLERDMVLNLCQYGMSDVWKWGGEVGGNCWRTTGDLGLAAGGQLPGFYRIGLSNARHDKHASPGQWNDPDYILIGWVGNARGMGEGKPTTLTGNEQYSYMSMWCLMAAPLIFSGDMAKLDEFTLNVLCNTEVIEIDQDPLGKQARIVRQTEDQLILSKNMEDGSLAVGLFNLSEVESELTVAWDELGIRGARIVRDVWRQQDLGRVEDRYATKVGRHGVMLIRLRGN